MRRNHSSFVFFFLWLVSIFATSINGDPYNPKAAPPPPSEVAGKEFPQSFLCNDPSSRCFGAIIACPSQCPTFKPSDQKDKACYVDCNSKNCESICRTRKPNCNSIGAACYDPRFVGGDGVMFYFRGKKDENFALVSDTNLQINARFIGRRPQGRSQDSTWIQSLGLMFGPHSFTLSANKVAHWDDQSDQFLFTHNEVPVNIPMGHLYTWSPPEGRLLVERTARCNSVSVTLPGVVEMSINVVPITREDDKIHNYQIPADDCFAHLEVQFKFLHLSEKVEGVLGQTYRPDFESPVKRGVPMPIMGGEDKYLTSSLLSVDCRHCIFKVEHDDFNSISNALELDPEMTLDCTSKMSDGRGFVCRR